MPARPTNLDNSRARAYCACSRCGRALFSGHSLSSVSLSLGDCLIETEILSQRAVKPKTTNHHFTSFVYLLQPVRCYRDRDKVLCFLVNVREMKYFSLWLAIVSATKFSFFTTVSLDLSFYATCYCLLNLFFFLTFLFLSAGMSSSLYRQWKNILFGFIIMIIIIFSCFAFFFLPI